MGVLRLLLALSVVLEHFGEVFYSNLVGGKIAVQAFYIISGFYMALILNEKYIGKSKSYFLFITNRFIRLYPIYWVVLLLTILFSLAVGMFSSTHYFPTIVNYLAVEANFGTFLYLIFTNILIFGQDIVMFLGISADTGSLYLTSNFNNSNPPVHYFLFIPQAWTLGVELSFYLVAPLILRKRAKLIFILCLCSLTLRLFTYNYLELQHNPWTYRFFPTELFFFLLGYFSYKIYLRLKIISIKKEVNIFIFVSIIILTILYKYLPLINIIYIPFSLNEIIYFSFITLSIPFLFNFLKNHKWDNKIGELSYPVYISHILIGVIFSNLPLEFFKNSLIISLATILFSMLLIVFIANPIEKIRQARVRR